MSNHAPPKPFSEIDRAGSAPIPYDLGSRLRDLRTTTVPWAIGIFCTLVGTLMLVVPHQFNGPLFTTIRPVLLPVGCVYLLVGFGLLLMVVLQPAPWSIYVTHTAASIAILFYASMLISVGSWSGGFVYAMLGLGTLAAGFLSVDHTHRSSFGQGDLFAVILGLCAFGNGFSLLVLANQFASSNYDLVRPYISWFGVAFVLSGTLLMLSQLQIRLFQPYTWLVHLFAGATFFGYMLAISIPTRGITGIVFYGGFGSLLIALPWLGHRLYRSDPRSLQLRLGLLLAASAVVPLTLAVAFLTNRQESIALDEALVSQQLLADAQAHELATYLGLHMHAITALATEIDPSSPPADQRAKLQTFIRGYPNLLACMSYDSAGQGIARTDGQSPRSTSGGKIFADVRNTGASALELRIASTTQRPTVVVAAPLKNATGTFLGIVGCGLETAHLADIVNGWGNNTGRRVYIIDQVGNTIAPNDQTDPPPTSLDLRAVQDLLSSGQEAGVLQTGEPPDNRVTVFARVAPIGWGVVVEHPIARALASIQRAREATFWGLVLLAAGAMVGGIAIARYLTKPLTTLGQAMDQFAQGAADAPLPQQSVTEIVRLSDAFRTMREQLLEAAEAREQAIRLRDIFFSVAAHELKTPLTSLLGQAELLQRRAQRDATLAEQHQRSVKVIIAQGYRLNRMVSALLDVSRIQHGGLALECAPLDLRELVQQVVAEIQSTLDHHTVIAGGDDQPVIVMADALRLEQVIQNLISNAVKYSPDGGTVEVDIARRNGDGRLAVTDHGLGIPAAALPYVFDRFYRAPNVEGSVIAGMGIGLYVVQEIMRLHNGSVAVDSIDGQGTTFTITLPLAS